LQRILRFLLPLTVLLLGALGLTACGGGGGGGGDSASTSTDVNTLLDKTFKDKKEIKSGKIDLSVKVDISGDSSVNGPFSLSLSGPFENQGKTKLPKFDVSLSASGQGQSIKAGAESTGDKGFVSFNGQDYSIPDNIFQQFKQGYEKAAEQSSKQQSGNKTSLSTLGIDPRQWLTNPKNAGEDKVGDTDVIKITGGVDVGKLLDDVNQALSKAGSLGLSNGQLPTSLTEQQKAQVEKAVKSVAVEIYTGKDDTILRRIKVDLTAQDPTGNSSGKLDLSFDLQLLDLNQGQDFPEPSNTKPIDQLLSQLGGLGGLGSVLGGASGGGSSSSGSGSSGSSAASQEKLKKYSDCLQAAGQDVSKAQKCASILG
jgi:hypothetical protein